MNSMRVIFKKTADNRALRLCILIGATCFMFGLMFGEQAILYMSTRYRFGWDEVQFSNFQAYNMVLTTVGTMICILIISKLLGWHDSIIGIMASCSKIAASFVYAFATTGTIFYFDKLNSIVGIFEVLMPLAYVPHYTQLYTATMEVMPGFIYLLGAILTIPVLFVFMWLLYKHLRSMKNLNHRL